MAEGLAKLFYYHSLVFALVVFFSNGVFSKNGEDEYITAVGDPGMKRDSLRVAIESWNQCNEAGQETPQTGSPRVADCFDIYQTTPLEIGTS